jgi:hypothetical protein
LKGRGFSRANEWQKMRSRALALDELLFNSLNSLGG